MIINTKKLQDRENGTIIDPNDKKYTGQNYHHSKAISFYDEPPHDVIGIYEFQSIAVSRLQVLKKIQFLYDQNKDNQFEQMAQEINSYSRIHNLNVEGIYDPSSKTQKFMKMT
jgi:hypothetical protein